MGEHAPVLAEVMKLALTPQSDVANAVSVLKQMATKKVQPSSISYMNAGILKGVGNFAQANGPDVSNLFNTKNNNILKVNDKNELIVLGKNQGDVNRALYENIDQSATNIINSLMFGGGLTGGIFAKGAGEKARQAVINTAFASGTMGEQLAEQLYNGEETSEAYKTALKDATVNWLSEMIGSPVEWANIEPASTLGRALASGIGEGVEEIIGNAMDRTWDVITNGSINEMSQQYQDYIDKGLSPKEATNRTLKDMVSDDLFAFMQAGAAGFAMGGTSAVNESVQKSTENKNIGSKIYQNQNETTFIEEAKKFDSKDIQKLVKKAEKAKTNGAKQKTRGELLNAVQEHNIEANNKEAYDTVYKTIAKHSNSTKVATEVAEAVVNGKKAKNTVAKQYVQDIESNNSRLAKRINDRLETIDYGTNVRQAYANTLTSEKSKSFEEYTQGLPTPQQLYNDVSAIRTSEFAKQDEEKQKVKSDFENRLQNRAETLAQENSQEEIAKENKQVLDDSTKEILNKGETADYSDVSGIASVDNGVVLLNTKDGDTVALGNVDFGNNEEDKTLFNLSSAFGDAANTFIANYKVNHQGENINTYFDRAQLAYNSGLNGVEYNKVFGESTYGMSEAEAKAFYEAGAKQGKVVAKNKAFKEKVKKMGKGVHIMDDVNLTEEQTKEVEVLSKIVEGTAKIVIAKSSNSAGVAKSNGYYDQNAIVIFAKEAGNAITSYAGHELTHYLKENVSKELYDDYHNFVIEQLKSKGESIYNDLVSAYSNAYDYDPQTQMQSIEEEMVADNGLAVFSDEKALTTLAKDNRTLLEKIHDFFKRFIDKLKDIKLKLSKSSAVYATINHDINFLEQSAQKIRTMLDNVQNVNVQSKEKFSLDVNLSKTDFESNIKKVANMKSVADLDGTEFSKGDTDLVTQVTEYFNSIGNKVDSKFGTIKLTRTGVKSSVAHGIGRNKAIAFKAVPDVLKHGEIIDYTENYKNSKKDRAVIAAPITIADKEYNVATVIEINSVDNTFYLHELALQNKKDVLPFKTEPRHSNGLLSDNTSSIYTLLEKLQDVNTKYSKNTGGYIKNGSQCDRVVDSLDKYLSKKYNDNFELDGNKVEFISIEQSHGMGSYATFYIDFSINDTDGITIRYSGHTNSSADYYLWNDDFSSMKEIKEAIDNIIIHEITVERPKRNELQSKYIKYSKNTLDSEGNELTEQQQEYFKYVAKELRDEDGRIKPFYHGTARADRVGYYFDPKRATSGPMAYFTDNEKIAGNYSRNKADTSLAYDSDYDSYDTQFRKNGKPIAEYWNSLNLKDKNELTRKIMQVTLDDEDNIVLDKNNKYGIGNFNDYELHNAKGNSIKVLVDGWLNDGTLWNEEERFIDVLNAVGISDVEYKNPGYREEKVYKVYLNITKPIVTTKISEDFINGLNSYLENTDLTKYNNVTANANMWDKNNIAIDEWIDKLTDDIADHTTYSWTSIPDVVTDFLKSNGYDGIIDEGGKGGGEGHTVAIPFYSNQIKLVDNLNPTDKSDIRYSKDTLEAEYIKAVDNGNEKEAEKALKSYAMQWGAYSLDGKAPLELYHGTQSFGFTEFDLNRMDDKRSIFLTDDIDTAQSYSGVYDVKKIAEGNFVDYDKMSMKELANELSKYDDEFVNYKYYSKQDIQKTINEANNKIKEVIKIGLPLVKGNSYSDYYSESSIIGDTDFSNPDVSNFLFWQADELKKQSLTIKEILDSYGYKFDLARRYYSDHEIINETEENNGAIIAEYKSKGSVHPYFRDYAINRLKNYNGDSRGNYKLYAKLNNPLVVDVEGRKWNNIEYKSPIERYIVDEAQYSKGNFQVTDVSVNQPIWIDGTLYFDNAEEAKNALNSYLKANNKDNKYYKYLNFTRDIAEYASNQGYDGVVFKNIVDYGGEGALSGVADNIIVVFDNKNVKSADTITYDDNGNVIPLSKRFSDKSDIRYSKDTNVDDFDYANYNEIKLGKKEYAIVSSAIVTKFTNKYSNELRSINYGDYIYSFVYNEDGVKFYERYNIDKYLKGLNEYGIYRKSKDNNRLSGLLKFAERDNSSSFGGNENRKSTGNVNSFDRETLSAEEKSNGIGYIENVDNDKQSRNTRLTLDDNIEDVNEAFLSAVKVLQNVHIDDIDLSSEVVTKAENAAKHIQNEVKKSGYRTQKLTGKGSVRSIATDLSEKYGNGKVTKSLVSELAELYDYIANSEVTDMSYVNSQAKIIANELINAKEETLVSATDKAPTQLLEELKRPVRIDESTKNQLAYDYGNWENAKRYISQFLNIDQKANDSALTLYEDLMSEYSDYINNEGDSVMNGKSAVDKLVDFAERTQDVIVNSYDNELAQTGFISEYDENGNLIGQYNSIDEFETAVASDIFDNFFDVEQVKNAIDKLKTEQKDKIRALREQAKEEKAVIRQTYKELYNQKLANEKQKYAESKEFYNQKLANEKQKLVNYKQYKKEVAERGRERKQTNLYKKRILRLKVQIERQLLNPKGANYVPRELVRSMADVCDIITGANVFNKNGTARSGYEALLSLQDRYQKLKNDPDYDYSSEYNEDMEQRLSDLKDSLKGKQLSNLSNAEMQNVYEIVKGISTSLSQAKKLINSSIKISAHQSAVELIKQQYATKGKGHTPFGKLDYDMMNVMRYVNLISEGNKDGILNKLFDDLNRGERKKDYLIMKWQKPFDELVKDNKNYKKFREKVIETPFIDVYGNKAKLTEAQIVQLIASAKREQGRNHLSGGGFVALDTKKAFKKGTTEAKIDGTKVENIADDLIPIIAELSNKLSPYAQKWLNLSENLFNEETKPEINETSFTLKGFKIANEKYYVPLLVDKDFTNAQLEGIMRDKSLENAGFTKEINKFAKNRIIIEGIDQVVERHINNVASYVSLTVPIRNFNKVWNGQTSQYYDSYAIDELNKKRYGNKSSFSVKETIKEKWGENAQKLIENAIRDLQTTRESNTSWIENKILNAEITATFMGNLSIVLKQAASYPTAVAVLSSTSLAKGSKGFAYFTGTKKLQSLFDEIDEHTGAHYKRRIGMQTEELAALSSSQSGFMGKWANSKFGALHPAKWIQAMDVQTTAALWLATKYEVDKMSRYKKGSAEYWQAVTDLYDKVIEETQPEYDVLHRAEIQKESNFLAKTVSLFQTQPLQNSGILYNSYREVMWAKRNYKNNKSEANQKALQAARKNAVKANWAIVSAGVTFSVFSFLATMLVLHKTKKYKDEDGKVTAKSVMEGIGKESVQTILSGFMPIIGSYAIEYASRILTAIKTGTLSDYDYIENMGLSAINNLLSSIAQLGIDGFNAISGKGTLDDLKKSSKDFAKQAAQIVGIPANNIDNFIQSGTAYYHELIKKDYALWEYSSQTPTSKEQIEKYVAYINEGDKANAEERMNKWLELNQDKDKSDFDSRVATYLASSDSDIVRAVQNRYSYNTAEYEKILNEVAKRGYSKQTVISAAQSVFNKVENTAKAKFYGNTDDYEEAFNELVALGYDEKTLQKHIDGLQGDFSNDETKDKIKGSYTVDELYKVWSEQGEESEAYKSMYDDILQTKIANGYDKEKAQESIKNSIKSRYKDNSPELQAAQVAYESGDMATYQRNINKVISQGKLDKEAIVSAARGTKSYKNTLWTATDYAKAIESGNKNQALSIYKDLCKANGNEKDERQYIRSSTTTYYRKKWLDTKTAQERKNILKHLRNAGFYTNSDIESLMTKWEKARKEQKKE